MCVHYSILAYTVRKDSTCTATVSPTITSSMSKMTGLPESWVGWRSDYTAGDSGIRQPLRWWSPLCLMINTRVTRAKALNSKPDVLTWNAQSRVFVYVSF